MPTQPQIAQVLRAIRSDLRALPEGYRAETGTAARIYRAAIKDAVKVVDRHLRRAGDGRSALAVPRAVRRSTDHQGA